MDLKDLKLDNLSRGSKFALFGALTLLLGGVVYWFYIKEPMEQQAALKQEIATLDVAVKQATAIELRLKQFKAEVAALDQRLEVLRSILPSQKETPIILERVQEMASSSNLKILKFTPQPTVPRNFYADWPIALQVEGSYDALGEFFSKISRSTRIINVDTLSVKGIEGATDSRLSLTATCTATTFVFREDQILAGDTPGGASPRSGN